MNQTDRSTLWSRLVDAAMAEGQVPEATSHSSPWYVRAMLGAAGWLAALFGLGFLVGTFAFLFVMFEDELNGPFMLLMLAVFEFALLLLPDFVHRAWCALAGALLAHLGLAMYGLEILSLTIIAAGFAIASLQDYRWPQGAGLMQPVGAALGIALAVVHVALGAGGAQLMDEVFWHSQRWSIWLPAWGATAALAIVLGAAVYHIAAKADASARTKTLALAGLIGVAAATHNAPGIIAALLIAVVGFAVSNRFLVGLGIVALLGYLSHFYYSLEQTLLHKSITLGASGATLIALWWLMGRVFAQPPPPSSDAGAQANA